MTFKLSIMTSLYYDIYILPETHCLPNENIEIDNYTIYQNNRVSYKNVSQSSGGIAIAIHNSVIECHTLQSVFKGVDGQIAIKLKCNKTEVTVGVLGLYLSPDSYRYGQDAEGFFNQASVLWEDLSDCDLRIGSGDLNARTKELVDYIPEIDGKIIPNRVNPDKSKNAHADNFITFLKDYHTIILNGRITPQYNNYTFVSTRGSSVPDYFFCPIENLYNCTEMKTILMSEVVNMLGLIPPRILPDHSILSGTFVTSFFNMGKNFKNLNSHQTTT